MPPNVRCHRCWKSFITKGRLIIHKASACPAPIASFKGRLRPPKPRLVYKPEPDGDEQESKFAKPEQMPSNREEPLKQDPETGHWTCVKCDSSYEDKWSAITHVASTKCKKPRPLKTKSEIKLDPERSLLVNQIPVSGLWTCNVCKSDRTFSKRRAVLLHANACSGGTTFKCEGCSYSSKVKEKFTLHLKSPTSCQYVRKRDLKRARKDARDKRRAELKSAKVKQVEDSKQWQCERCEKTFSRQYTAVKHAVGCNGTTNFSCDSCTLNTQKSSKLARHVQSHRYMNSREPAKVVKVKASEKWKCEICERIFSTRIKASIHARSCNGTIEYSCDSCSFNTRRGFKLARHAQSKSCAKNREPPKVVQDDDSDDWLCTICNKTFPSLRSAASHGATCTGEDSPFVCETCDYTTNSKTNLSSHLKSITGCQNRYSTELKLAGKAGRRRRTDYSSCLRLDNGQWTCLKCQRHFQPRDSALSHVKYSKCSDTMRFTCSKCNFKTNHPQTFRIHSKEDNSKCQAAQRRIKRNEKLAKALVSVSRPSKAVLHCPSCAFSTVKRHALRQHLRAAKCRKNWGENISKASPSRQFQCPKCPYQAKKWNLLLSHQASDRSCQILLQRQKVQKKLDLKSLPEPGTLLTCPKCSYSTNLANQMYRHLSQPRLCMYRIRQQELRQRLGDSQLQDRPIYRCPKCPYQTTNTGNIRCHLDSATACRTEKEWRPTGSLYTCPRCSFRIRGNKAIRAHMDSRSACAIQIRKSRINALNGKRECENCDRSFASSKLLLNHMDMKICRPRGLKMVEM